MEKDFKVDKETAISEFERFCELNEIDCDESEMTEDDLTAFKPLKERFVKACMAGRVEVDGIDIKYTVSQFSEKHAGEVVTIKRPTGKSFIAMDGNGDKQAMRKLQAFISAMTGREIVFFTSLDSKDWKFFQSVATLFLVD